jgi:hypothetical protein
MKDENKLTVTGASGKEYVFWAHTWGTRFRDIGGVYLVLRQQAGGGYDVLYVGQTDDLSAGLENDLKKWCFEASGGTHIAAAVETREKSRIEMQDDLLSACRPLCNG